LEVKRAGSSRAGASQDVEVNHGGFDRRVAHEVLDGADTDGVLKLALHGRLVEVVAGDPPGPGMGAGMPAISMNCLVN
jgi:hypothetical protein